MEINTINHLVAAETALIQLQQTYNSHNCPEELKGQLKLGEFYG